MEDSFNRASCGVVIEERGFTGHTDDYETDLVYMQQRYYDPTVGRFLSTDPVGPVVGDAASINRYSYGKNNPYLYLDPNGEAAETGWDILNVSIGVASFAGNVVVGNWGSAAVDGVGLVYDSFATAVPFLPAGAGAGLKAYRGTKAVSNAANKIPDVPKGTDKLYHYTDNKGLDGITNSNKLNPSLKANNPNDARYGDGQYLSDIAPGAKTCSQLSRCFFGNPFQGKKVENFLEIDVKGLNVQKGRDGVYVVPGDKPLDLTNRITGSGKN